MKYTTSIPCSLLRSAILAVSVMLACAIAICPAPARASSVAKKVIEHVNVDEHLDALLPLDAQFLDHTGQAARLGDVLGGGKKPSVLILAYHSCPVLCSMVQSAAAASLQGVKWSVGKDYDVVVISIDPLDKPDRAAEKRAVIMANYGRPGVAKNARDEGFHFLTGSKTQIDRVAEAVGFKYDYDPEQRQYGHPAVMMFVKPSGHMARYLYGLEYDPNDVRLALYEAANERSISTIEKMVLYCYMYNPEDGKYVVMATRVMKLGGALTVLILGGFLSAFWLAERKRSRREAATKSSVPQPTSSSVPTSA